jgi:2,3-bisphosphoglycerate-independent phosphoglycerate mutase
MDRDHRWERVEKAYRALTEGKAPSFPHFRDVVNAAYEADKTDEFIEPSLIVTEGQQPTLIKEGDAVIFYNFRIDRPRELTKAFVLENFEQDANKAGFDPYAVKYHQKHTVTEEEVPSNPPFSRGPKIPNLSFVMMTEYEKDLPAEIAFPPNVVTMPLGRILSENGVTQLRMAESEKEAFVTHYFNGLRSAPFPMEDRIIVPSPKVPTYDQKPEMSAYELTDQLIKKISEGNHRFILVNYANADMVAHTGNLQASIQAVKVIDDCFNRVIQAALDNGYALIVTADHGNVEEMIDPRTGGASTEHSANPVPFIAIAKEFESTARTLQTGVLADIAPTVLNLLNIPQPQTMTGRNLLEEIRT